jgi:hypothetical protein
MYTYSRTALVLWKLFTVRPAAHASSQSPLAPLPASPPPPPPKPSQSSLSKMRAVRDSQLVVGNYCNHAVD